MPDGPSVKDISQKYILDACCGGRMFWYDKHHPNALYVDKRVERDTCIRWKMNHNVLPDIRADFKCLPFPDNHFYLVVFDPPHMKSLRQTSYMAKKYGTLFGLPDWRNELKCGFIECWRVLRPMGTLIFKWSEVEISVKEVIEVFEEKPLFGHISGRRSKTHWICYMKGLTMPDRGYVLQSATVEWSTPQWLFDELNEQYHFTLDVCATEQNAKCERFYTKEDDGLSKQWSGSCWMNPPYGREVGKWMKKASEQSCLVVCLVPARTDTNWWHEYAMTGHITFLRGRLKFGGAKYNAPFPSAVVVFNGEPYHA